MGYTHYWYRAAELDPATFRRWSRDVWRLAQALPPTTETAGGFYRDRRLTLHGADGLGEPRFTASCVAFNGRCGGRSSVDELGHEAFYLPRVFHPEPYQTPDPRGRYFAFCKTARKPYDLLVTAALVALKHHFPEVQVLSDGHAEDWSAGLRLTRDVLGNGVLPFNPHTR
ncbi:MAG: hypothetical protein AAGE65_11505 [Planctomycetota bacterium]